MATETERIKKLLKNNWDGPMWHGNNLTTVLKDITWQMAFKKPEGFSHSIYEYVMHMQCWRKFVLEYLKGNNTYSVELNSETDWATNYEQTEASWNEAMNTLTTNQAELMNHIDAVTDAQLDELVPGKKFRWYVFLHGVIHHDIYHSAQIAVLKKTLSPKS